MEALGPPSEVYVRRRQMPAYRVAWAKEAFDLMLNYGAVSGRTIYARRHEARWRARYLMDKLVVLELADRSEMHGHVDRADGGFTWMVEYLPVRRVISSRE
jgi:hypothetical protein